ncbi:unnamed protein product, partial [Polarella glacialis]
MSSRSIRGLMAFALLLTALAAGVVQPYSCKGDCKGARAQVLLQTGSVGHRFSAHGSGDKLQLASMSLSEESSLVEGFVNEVLTSGKPLTGIQKEIIERLNETFDLENKSQSVATLNSQQSSLGSGHTECVAQQGSLQGQHKIKQEELTAYLTALQPPSSVVPEQRALTPDMDNYITQNLEFFENFQSSYASLKAQISTLEAEVENKTAGCAEGRLIFDAKFCLWKTEVENAKGNYLHCRTQAGNLYQETLKTAHSNAEGRRADRDALVK